MTNFTQVTAAESALSAAHTHTLKPKCHSAKSESKFATPKYIHFSIFIYLFIFVPFVFGPVKARSRREKRSKRST